MAPYAELRLRALRGVEAEATPLITNTVAAAARDGQGLAATNAHWATAVLYNGLGQYESAARAAARATTGTGEFWVSAWALPELVEAAVRLGDDRLARDAMERLAAVTDPCRTDLASGVAARSRALLAEGETAREHHLEAIGCLRRTSVRPELARAHLLYGEWLRRQGRRIEARTQLRTAYEQFVSIGMEAFAERTRRELLATGERLRRRAARSTPPADLTAQERQIALLARDGLSNTEIGQRLFLSPRTVEWHLRKVFAVLAVSSRRQLRAALDGEGGADGHEPGTT